MSSLGKDLYYENILKIETNYSPMLISHRQTNYETNKIRQISHTWENHTL